MGFRNVMQNRAYETVGLSICAGGGYIYLWGSEQYWRKFHYAKKDFGYEVYETMIKQDGKLKVSDRSIADLQECYADAEDEGKKLSVIMNIGKKRSGKSFCSCMESLFLCEKGCRFRVGEKDDPCTIGIDISPPLKKSQYISSNFQDDPDDLVILDIEGFDDENNEIILDIARIWAPLTSICVQSCMVAIEERDKYLFKRIHDIIQESNDKTTKNTKYIMAVAPARDVKKGRNWRDIKKMNDEIELSEVPLFDGVSTIGSNVKTALQTIPFLNPIKYMEKAHVRQYRQFASTIEENLTKTVHPSQVLEAIKDTADYAKKLT